MPGGYAEKFLRPANRVVFRTWHLFDGSNQIVGRIAKAVSLLLLNKHRPNLNPTDQRGDTVVVVNCAKLQFAGRKWETKVYRHHSGYPGGLKEVPALRMLERRPTEILRRAVFGMLPKNNSRKVRMTRLHLYPGETHPHPELNFVAPTQLISTHEPLSTPSASIDIKAAS